MSQTDPKTSRDPVATLDPEMLQALKYESLGRMLPGLVHNLSTPLEGIILTAEAAQRKHSGFTEFATILKVAGRLEEILLNVIGKLQSDFTTEPADLDLNALLCAELQFLQADLFFKHEVSVELDLAETLPRFRGVSGDLAQVLGELLRYVLETMHSAKRKTLRVMTEAFAEQRCVLVAICGSSGAESETEWQQIVKVSADQKSWMYSSAAWRLAVVRALVEQNGGEISVRCAGEGGIEFQVRLPIRRGCPKSA